MVQGNVLFVLRGWLGEAEVVGKQPVELDDPTGPVSSGGCGSGTFIKTPGSLSTVGSVDDAEEPELIID